MALSRLLQPNSTFRLCRLGFSAARAKFCSLECYDGDGCSPPQLKEETAVEDIKIMLPEHIVRAALVKEPGLPEASSLGNMMAEYGSPRKPQTLSDMFVVHKDDPTETMAGNEEVEHEEALLDYLTMSVKDEKPFQSNGSQNGLGLKHSAMRSADGLKSEASIMYHSCEHSNEPREEDVEKDPFKDLVRTLSVRAQDSLSNPSKLCSSTGLTKDNSSNANMPRSDKHDRSNSLNFLAGTSTIKDIETSKSGFDPVESKEQNQCLKASAPTSNKDQRQRQTKNTAKTEPEGYKVLVRFLRSSVSESKLLEFFKHCGEILRIECPDVPRSLLKTACIDFKTKNGLEKALARSGMYLVGPIIVESATSENRSAAIPIPSLHGDPDIPAALIKNPTRTIRIQQLTEEINSSHIVEALAFCKSNISGYFLGFSPSVAYVELETETGKERALAKQSINVLGNHLVMLRIDCPRTTVIRITSRCPLEMKEVMPICRSLGDTATSFFRDPYVVDVHFKVSEWPNMVKILNRLNGCIVNGRLLHAEPAPIFPPEVLLALWHHPEERKHLKATAHALLLKLESKLDTSELAFLENDLFST